MSRKILAKNNQFVKLIVGAGQASPSPPVGPALGSKGVKSMDFCKVTFYDSTQYIYRTSFKLLTFVACPIQLGIQCQNGKYPTRRPDTHPSDYPTGPLLHLRIAHPDHLMASAPGCRRKGTKGSDPWGSETWTRGSWHSLIKARV